jgi:hypothetical protein
VGVDSVLGWLKRLDIHPGSQEECTQMRRMLGYLVVNLGRDPKTKVDANSVPPFMAAERCKLIRESASLINESLDFLTRLPSSI